MATRWPKGTKYNHTRILIDNDCPHPPAKNKGGFTSKKHSCPCWINVDNPKLFGSLVEKGLVESEYDGWELVFNMKDKAWDILRSIKRAPVLITEKEPGDFTVSPKRTQRPEFKVFLKKVMK